MRETKKVTSQRLQLVAPTLIRLHQLGQVAEVQTPGFELHWRLIEETIVRSWIHGELTAARELQEARQRRVATFNDPPPLEWPGPPPGNAIEWARQRRVLLGKWNRDLDAEVTRVLVQTLETGASSGKMMQELAEVFPTFTSRRLEMIARTETTAALNQGRLARFRDPDGGVEAVQFVAILDARVTDICRARDGLILRLDDPRLASNTPPLHINCRSTLVPVMDIDMEDLAAGDESLQKRYFGWLEGENAPKNLSDALAGWDDAPAPAKGFGALGSRPKPPKKPKRAPRKASNDVKKPERAPSKPAQTDLRDWVDERKRLGIDDPDDVRDVGRRVLADVDQLLSATAEEAKAFRVVEAEYKAADKSVQMANQKRRRGGMSIPDFNAEVDKYNEVKGRYNAARSALAASRQEAIVNVLSPVIELGGVTHPLEPRTPRAIKDSLARVSAFLPKSWLQSSVSSGRKLKGSKVKSGGSYSDYFGAQPDVLRASGSGERLDTIVLHEFGHRLEKLVPGLKKQTMEYLNQRTLGEPVRPLRSVYPGLNYGSGPKVKPDKFAEPYFGRVYPDGTTEILSMGLESVIYSTNYVWEQDRSMVEFIIGALAAL